MTRTHWWMLSAVLAVALTCAAASAQTCTSCPHSACGGASTCTPAAPVCADEKAVEDEEAETAEAEAKCACENCECKDGKCKCEDCKCAKCAGAKAKKCDCAQCKCGCEKCDCSKAAAAKSSCASGCCAKGSCASGCCAKGSCASGCCAKKTAKADTDAKETGESESVHIVLEDLTINYFGAGVTIKKIKVSYKGQGIEAGEMAKDLSSIGRAPACYPAPTCCVPCVPASAVPPPPPMRLRAPR